MVLVLVRDDHLGDGAVLSKCRSEQGKVCRFAFARVEEEVGGLGSDEVRVGPLEGELARILAQDANDRVRDLAGSSERIAGR